MQNVMILFIDK